MPARPKKFRGALGAAIATFSVGALTACGSTGSTGSTGSAGDTAGSQGLRQVVLAVPGASPIVSTSFIPVGVAKGFFKDQGIDLKVNYIQGGTVVASAVQAGQADLALTSPEPLVLANSQGGDLKSIYQVANKPIYAFGFLPNNAVKGVADLPKARIGVVSAGSVTTYQALLNFELAGAGLPPVQTSSFVPVGEGSSANAAVQTGNVDVLFLTDTGLETIKLGVPDLRVQQLAASQGFPGLALMARQSVITEKADLLKATLKGFAAATQYCVDKPAECMDDFAKAEPNAVPDRKVADAQWAARSKLYGTPVDGKYGQHSRAAWEQVAKEQYDAGLVKSAPQVDTLYSNDLVP